MWVWQNSAKDDTQQSFWLAETLKSLYLLFSPDEASPPTTFTALLCLSMFSSGDLRDSSIFVSVDFCERGALGAGGAAGQVRLQHGGAPAAYLAGLAPTVAGGGKCLGVGVCRSSLNLNASVSHNRQPRPVALPAAGGGQMPCCRQRKTGATLHALEEHAAARSRPAAFCKSFADQASGLRF